MVIPYTVSDAQLVVSSEVRKRALRFHARLLWPPPQLLIRIWTRTSFRGWCYLLARTKESLPFERHDVIGVHKVPCGLFRGHVVLSSLLFSSYDDRFVMR
jgi:hypothetical protein